MLERERLQWQRERLSLVSCIELQQRELSRRASAVHEKATEIAKEFAKTIEMFEERLIIGKLLFSFEKKHDLNSS